MIDDEFILLSSSMLSSCVNYLCWSVDEKREDLVRQLGGEEEEKYMLENPQQMENNTALSNQRQNRAGLTMSQKERRESLHM